MKKIFQVTADLIFLLKCIVTKPELTEKLKDAYEDLFGFSFDNLPLYYTMEAYENPFSRVLSTQFSFSKRHIF
jgi:hypothetical protein